MLGFLVRVIVVRLIDKVNARLLALWLVLLDHFFVSLHIVILFVTLTLKEHGVEGLINLGVDDCAGDF